ncbi:iron-sulfur cluster carrier protein ApbC [SAR92 clade bacterium H455]|uniref:Iron-sulfur cluster carrier protein n=1 Tax=SAR92 clade bacterium H455 TaxID=2974818 RepID=A0ABY5TLW7_9GAMM|nr:iron-sulfur cluster carrier protein ApbC [SAR92 clade bacterium H455]
MLAQVKQIIAVASGKGGVGKSTTAVNLALALQAEGKKVGLLDADIYGPSIAMMMGVAEGTRPATADGKSFTPVMANGLETMSMAYLVSDKTPMAWRGPMASGALQQLLEQTDWGELDVLVVDMPPGTGDIQLTLAQKAAVAGAVIVTTPQDIALLDAQKGIEMFTKVKIPVLGIIENMAVHLCSNCGHEDHIFGSGGGEKVAADYSTQLLGSMPLDRSIRERGDSGLPSVAAEPESDIAQRYGSVARQVIEQLAALDDSSGPEIVFD